MPDDMAQNEHEWLHSGKWIKANSSNPSDPYSEELRWDNEAELLYVRHPNGRVWKYGPVTKNMAEELIFSPSPGGWIWDHIRVRGSRSAHQVPIAEPA